MACRGVACHGSLVRWYMRGRGGATRVLERGLLVWQGGVGCPTAGNLTCWSKGVHWGWLGALVMVESVRVGHLVLYLGVRIVLVWVYSVICLVVVRVVAQVSCGSGVLCLQSHIF